MLPALPRRNVRKMGFSYQMIDPKFRKACDNISKAKDWKDGLKLLGLRLGVDDDVFVVIASLIQLAFFLGDVDGAD